MVFPTQDEIRMHILELSKDMKEHHVDELYRYIIEKTSLSADDVEKLNPAGYEPKYKNDIRWAKQELKIEGLICYPQKSFFQLTESGRNYIQNQERPTTIKELEVGDVLSNRELCDIFKCGTQGGMRRSHGTNSLVLISDPTKELYEDRWEDDILHYTGMGKKGDQKLDFMQNKTLFESNINSINIHLFEVHKKGEYYYHGLVSLANEPYFEKQLDEDKKLREVVIFPLQLLDEKLRGTISKDLFYISEEIKTKNAQKMSDLEVRERALEYNKKPGQRRVTSINYQRNSFVSENAKRRANGICQLCGNPAPFNNSDGTPYLETHHIIWLSREGEDSIENTAALCPNCHRKMHILDLKEDIIKLQAMKK